jgi:hypothetical protein
MERLGMRREAHFVENMVVKGEWTDELVYAILDHEWKARPEGRAALVVTVPGLQGRRR